jgi:hypothetical protein
MVPFAVATITIAVALSARSLPFVSLGLLL